MSPVHRATCYRCGVGVGCARAGQREAGLSIIGAIIPPWRGVPSATSADRTPRSLDRSMGNSPCWRMAILGWPTYEGHPRTPTDTRACSAVSKTVPQYQMRQAHSTTPGEDPPQVDPRSIPPGRPGKRLICPATHYRFAFPLSSARVRANIASISITGRREAT